MFIQMNNYFDADLREEYKESLRSIERLTVLPHYRKSQESI